MFQIESLDSGYGRVPILRDVGFEARPGEMLLVAGENGAGKTTLMRTLSGLLKPSRGRITLDGKELAGRSPLEIVRSGVRLVLDGHRVFPELSVLDNLRLGGAVRGYDSSGFRKAADRVFGVFPILGEKRDHEARDLSGGQQQMLALGQAFLAQPKVLLCDEPSTGLAQALLPPIMAFIRQWAIEGTAVVMVEQHLDLASRLCDRVLVLDRGRVTLRGPAVDLQRMLRAT
ncbi:MAG TPA: ABC transporter ATP-binding protein [Ramlibacter sp.]|uniref:ABC transporter ATP-binding protein n=1 Tax=Ramlibacter sp. TaxID=1917967 RepID=UPI002D0BBD84|nr:ABC transporter ATP-binding protein [Ramlibacter sp.]HVZ45505.1 ABC transporter ATP-binding protein [Ramlibacter sp.]